MLIVIFYYLMEFNRRVYEELLAIPVKKGRKTENEKFATTVEGWPRCHFSISTEKNRKNSALVEKIDDVHTNLFVYGFRKLAFCLSFCSVRKFDSSRKSQI